MRHRPLALLFSVGLAVGLVLPAAPAQAAATIERNVPVDITLQECGETITLSGTLLLVFQSQALPNEGYLFFAHANSQGVTGTSESGAIYRGTGVTGGALVVVPSGGLVATYNDRFHIVGTSGAPTFYIKATIHTTVSPTGELIADVYHYSLECV